MSGIRTGFVGLSVLALCAAVPHARAATNLVQNGNFSSYTLNGTTNTTSYQVQTADNSNNTGGVVLQNWKNDGYTFVFQPGTADTTGAVSTEYNSTLKLWGPNDGSNNGLTAQDPLPGGSGAYVGLDGDYQQGPLYQTVTGLTVGAAYYIGFDWAAAQQTPYTGVTTEQLLVNIGGTAPPTSNGQYQFATNVVTNPSEGFTPWAHVTFYFTATAASETLSFLSNGTPQGVPPFALLDNVSVIAAPEPTTWAVMVAGLTALGFGGRFWRRGRTGLSSSAA